MTEVTLTVQVRTVCALALFSWQDSWQLQGMVTLCDVVDFKSATKTHLSTGPKNSFQSRQNSQVQSGANFKELWKPGKRPLSE